MFKGLITRDHITSIFRCIILTFLICLNSPSSSSGQSVERENRWFFVQKSLQSDDDVRFIKALVDSGRLSGMNGIVLSSQMDSVELQKKEYISQIKKIKKLCSDNFIEIVPCIFSVGYAGGLLSQDKNLAEGFPVKDLLFEVKSNVARPLRTPSDLSEFKCGFEWVESKMPCDIKVDAPEKVSFRDTKVSRSGNSSIRFENFCYNTNGNARLSRNLKVRPFTSYVVSLWYKAENLPEDPPVKIQVIKPNGRVLTWMDVNKPSEKWQQVSLEFNSLEYEDLILFIGIWRGTNGRFWIDDLEMSRQSEIIGLLQRPGTPFIMMDTSTNQKYHEGFDFTLRNHPSRPEQYEIFINPNGMIKEGEKLRVSYFRKYGIGKGQISACMSLPQIYEIWRKQIKLIDELLHPKAYFLSMDEIRQGGYCELCRHEDMSQLLGRCITKQHQIIKEVNPDASIYIWSDMLDPHVNAGYDYCMTRGGFPNAWQFIPKDIIPVVWNYGARGASLSHFQRYGFKVMASINVDENSTESRLRDWKKTLENYNNISGVIYATWRSDYSKMNIFKEIFFE